MPVVHKPRMRSSRRLVVQRLGWTAALAACLLAGIGILPRDTTSKPAPPPTITDADLLGQVATQLSQAVPPSLAPIELSEVRK